MKRKEALLRKLPSNCHRMRVYPLGVPDANCWDAYYSWVRLHDRRYAFMSLAMPTKRAILNRHYPGLLDIDEVSTEEYYE